MAGGTSSALAGGKFEDGAIRAAFVHMYNDRGLHPTLEASWNGQWGSGSAGGLFVTYAQIPQQNQSNFFDDIGEFVTRNSSEFKTVSKYLFKLADFADKNICSPCGNIPRIPGIYFGALGIIGGNNVSTIEGSMQQMRDMKGLIDQGRKFFTTPSLAPQAIPDWMRSQ